MLKRIDGWLIDKIFQPISNKFRILTGRDCFFLAKTILILIFPLLAIFLALSVTRLAICLLLGLSLLGMIYFTIPILKKRFENTGCMNPERIDIAALFLRITNVIMTSIMTSVSFQAATTNDGEWTVVSLIGWANVASLYFMACTPLPPCKSWVSKMVSNLKGVIGGSITPAAKPAKAQ